MPNAQDHRAKSAEFARRAREAASFKDMKEFRERAQAFTNLAENEEWVVANPDKIISNRAPQTGRSVTRTPKSHRDPGALSDDGG